MDNLLSLDIPTIYKAHQSQTPPFGDLFTNLSQNTCHFSTFAFGREALTALFRKKGWKRIALPAFCCPIIYQAIISSGATPVLFDIDPTSFTLDQKIISPDDTIDAVVAVHTFGYPVDLAVLRKKLSKHTAVISDCAHSLSLVNMENCDYVLVSLYKEIPNFGGSVLISKEDISFANTINPSFPFAIPNLLLFKEIRFFVNILRRYQPLPSGDNLLKNINNLPPLCLRLFSFQIKAYSETLKKRKDRENILASDLDSNYFLPQQFPHNANRFNYSFLIKFGDESVRDQLLLALRRKGIFTDRQWYNSVTGGFQNARKIAAQIINIPLDIFQSEKFLMQEVKEINITAKQFADGK